MAKYLSGRSKRTPQSGLRNDRYRYLGVNQTEPNLGDPVLPGPVLPVGQQYQSVSIIGYPGERYWVPISGGLIPGSISIYDEGLITPPGGVSSITQLNFVGAAITAKGYLNPDGSPGVGVTITVFSPGTQGQVIFNNNNDFKGASGLFYDNSTNYVGIGTSLPTQELDLTGDLRLRGTIYDYNNQPGTNSQILVKNNFDGLTWVNQSTLRAGAGGTITNIQYHNDVGLVDGASNFVFDYTNNRVGIGSTQPGYLLDVLGYSRFKGQTEIDYLRVTGVATIATLGVSGLTTTKDLQVAGFSTFTGFIDANGGAYIDNVQIGITNDNTIDTSTDNLTIGSAGGRISITGITSVGFITATTGFVGILTVTEINIERTNLTDLNVTGIATIATLGVGGATTTRNLNVIGITTTGSLGVTGLTTTRNLKVTGIATFDNLVNSKDLNVSGVGTLGNVKISGGTVATDSGNLTLDSLSGTTQINDDLYVNSATESIDINSGSIYTDGGVGIEKNLNVGGELKVTGIVTTVTDLYIGGDLYVKDDIFYDELFARNGYFTGIVSTKDFETTGITTLASLGVTGLTTTRNLKVIGISTFDNYIDANGGAYIDNIQIGISDDNEIDTTSGNLTIDSAGGTTTIDDNLTVSGTSNLNGNVIFGDATTDTVSFTSRISSNVLPSTNATSNTDVNGKDLGSSSNTWRKVYAIEYDGKFIGNADSATKLQTPRSISATNDITWSVVFDGSTNVSSGATLKDSGVAAGTYGSSTQVGIVTVDSKGRITSASNVTIGFANATVAKADSLTTSRNFSITGDVDAPAVSFNGTGDVNLVTTLDDTGVTAGTYGSSTQVGIVTVDAKGRITSASNVTIAFSSATVDKADKIKTTSSTSSTLYPTFVDSNNTTADYESLYTDAGITYDATADVLSSKNLSLGSGSYFGTSPLVINGTVGDNDSHLVIKKPSQSAYSVLGWDGQVYQSANIYYSDGGWVHSAPSGNNNNQLFVSEPGRGVRWYASSNGTGSWNVASDVQLWNDAGVWQSNVSGNSASATKLQTPRSISIGDVSGGASDLTWSVSFDGSADVNAAATLKTVNANVGTYGDTTTIPQITVNGKGLITGVTNKSINFSTATVAKADSLTTSRNIAITGDLSWNVNFNGTSDVTAVGTLASLSPNPAGIYGDTTTIPKITVDSKGRITSVTNTGINFSTATVSQADKIKTTSSTATVLYPTFVDSNNTTADYESLYTDAGITYDATADVLTVSNIKPTKIQDSTGGTGTANYVLTANGTGGGWSWKSITGGTSPAIGGITIQDEGITQGTPGAITTLNFTGGSVSATSPTAGTANISITAASDIFVNQTNYSGTNPITVFTGNTIRISSASNAYGRRYIQSTQPTGFDGDIWYDTSGSTTGGFTPAGTVIYFASSTAPPGYIKANGAPGLSITAYSALFAAIGYTFGGSGASFNLPDLRGEFIRGWDDARGVDSGRTFGIFQGDAFQGHRHQLVGGRNDNRNYHEIGSVRGHIGPGWQQSEDYGDGWIRNPTTDNVNGAPRTATETRPRNIALLACIKY